MADTVVDPRAMMVHFEHAEATLSTVVGTSWLPSLLPTATPLVTEHGLGELAVKRRLQSDFDSTWVGEGSTEVTDVGHETETIEEYAVDQASQSQRNALDQLLVDICLAIPVENMCPISHVLSKSYQRQYLYNR